MSVKTCVRCSVQFSVTDGDRAFYQNLNIFEPTHCPECRVKRRMMWRNDRTFWYRKSDLSGKTILAMYPPEVPFPVYTPEEWFGDSWDAQNYAQDFDFNRPFFEQWQELSNKVPRLSLSLVNCQNSDYCNYSSDEKNCYLDIAAEGNEDCYFDLFTKYSRNCVDSTFVYNSELMYECINCYDCYGCFFGIYLDNCSDCLFCFDLKGCNNCLFSANLRQKEYYIFNKKYSREEYLHTKEKLQLRSSKYLQQRVQKWQETMKQAIHRDMVLLNSENCTGNHIYNSKNCHSAFNIKDCEDSKFLYDVLEAKTCYDLNYSLYDPEADYELISTIGMKLSAFSFICQYCTNVFYCTHCYTCSDCFGCIGLKHQKYCILNKQYTKEEYEKLVPRIISHMQQAAEWGEFLPHRLSSYGYNQVVAQEYFPLTKEEAIRQGYQWKDIPEPDFSGVTKKIPAQKLPDQVTDIPDDILNWAIECTETKKLFKIQKAELEFYRKNGLPIPRFAPDVRHRHRMQTRNPRRLFERTCSRCGKSIKTTYHPSRPETVYCESCYLKNIY